MSRIDQLIAELAPHGVPYKTVSDVAVYVRGVTYSKHDEQPDGPIRVLRSNNITLSSNTLNFDDVRTVAERVRVRPDQRLKAEDILISAASGSKAHVGKVAYVWEDIDYCFGGFMAVLRVSGHVDSRFLFHLLIGKGFSNYLEATLTSTTINNLNSSTMGGFSIPVPPLEVQREIVKILDTFTELEAELESELEAELEARRRQHGFYWSSLLAPGDEWRMTTLGAIAEVFDGPHATPTKTDSGPWYLSISSLKNGRFDLTESAHLSADEFSKWTRRVFPRAGDTMFSYETRLGQAAYWDSDVPAVLGRRMGLLRPREAAIDPQFLTLVYLGPQFQGLIESKTVRGSTVDRIPIADMKSWELSIPPLAEQKRIVKLLRGFDGLMDEINVGLSAELGARRKQYEHYRDRLLTFEEAAA